MLFISIFLRSSIHMRNSRWCTRVTASVRVLSTYSELLQRDDWWRTEFSVQAHYQEKCQRLWNIQKAEQITSLQLTVSQPVICHPVNWRTPAQIPDWTFNECVRNVWLPVSVELNKDYTELCSLLELLFNSLITNICVNGDEMGV